MVKEPSAQGLLFGSYLGSFLVRRHEAGKRHRTCSVDIGGGLTVDIVCSKIEGKRSKWYNVGIAMP